MSEADCNDCEHINITEDQQRRIGNSISHFCMKYRKPIFHGIRKLIAPHYKLHPCGECGGDGFKRSEKRCQIE